MRKTGWAAPAEKDPGEPTAREPVPKEASRSGSPERQFQPEPAAARASTERGQPPRIS
ncbi:hypothetical protein ACFPN7_27990 [Amycolatopsis halotolerans]|uniref:hypothetical protein n=1 Tax=Amycolatopsis halotolerans TaxID=330083 RepID=UPI00360B4F26